MGWQAWFSLTLVLSSLLVLVFSRVPAHMVMLAALAILSVCGILTPAEAFAGFSNPGVITVVVMFILAAGIHTSGGVDLLVNRVLGRPNTPRSALARFVFPVMGLSAFLNNTPLVATMIPALTAWSRRIGIAPGKLMIPLSYAAILGGTITLVGTSTNLVVDGLYQSQTGNPSLGLFSIAIVGLPVAILGGLFIVLWMHRWLPDGNSKTLFANMREFTLEVAIAHGGPLVGKTVEEAGLRHLKQVYLVEIERDGNIVTAVPSEETLRGGDRLIFAGETEAISELLRIHGIVPSAENPDAKVMEQNRAERCLVEAVVSPHCSSVGQTIRDARFREQYGAVVLAVAREGERVKGNLSTIRLKAGDTLLLEARPAFVTRQRYNKDFLLINDLQKETPRHERALLAWGILFVVMAAAAFGLTSMLNAALIGAVLMLVTGCISMAQAQRSMDMQTILTIAASFALGAALEKTGVAAVLADYIVQFSHGSPWLMLLLMYLAVSLLTEVITNNAAAVVMVPIALAMAKQAGINPEPFILGIMMAASASFATPIGYQTNLMVYGPGGYKFADFLRVGVPMNLFVGVLTCSVLIWVYL
jgi:di/tricarboxylate transporter